MLSGGLPLIQAFQPEFLVGVDGTLAFDTPDLLGQQSDLRLGAGPALKWMDAIRGKMAAFVPDLEFARRIRRLAGEQRPPVAGRGSQRHQHGSHADGLRRGRRAGSRPLAAGALSSHALRDGGQAGRGAVGGTAGSAGDGVRPTADVVTT